MSRAFSLLELLIVIGIIGILAAISYPLYTHHLARVNCQQATTALLEMANKLEQEHSISGSYANVDIKQLIPHHAQNLPYRFYLSHATKENYVINAIAIKPHTQSLSCQRLTISEHAFLVNYL